jgi:hypothetical protein
MMPAANPTQPRPPSRAKALTCPVCGEVARRSFDIQLRPGDTIRTDCLCHNAHVWSVRWSEAG